MIKIIFIDKNYKKMNYLDFITNDINNIMILSISFLNYDTNKLTELQYNITIN